MPSTTARLGITIPVSSDPANVPVNDTDIADAVDGGDGTTWSGATIMYPTPGIVGSVPSPAIVGTFYAVNSSPPYLLYYTGEATTATATVPAGWRNVGGPGYTLASITATNPGNSSATGSSPVNAALDHGHALPPWSSGQTTAVVPLAVSVDGNANAFARANHQHAYALPTILAEHTYAPFGGASYSISANTITALDTTNLAVTFVAPVSGNVTIEILPTMSINATGAGGFYIGFINTTNTALFGTASVIGDTNNGSGAVPAFGYKQFVTGLTPGQSYTACLGMAKYVSTSNLFVGPGIGISLSGVGNAVQFLVEAK